MQVTELIQEAMSLPPGARFEIAEQLMLSLAQPNPDIDRAWAEEALRRLDAHKRGLTQGIPAEDVLGPF
jgi:putative addiction module component (TIGR02574 family)